MGPDDRVIIEYVAQQILLNAMSGENTVPKKLLESLVRRYKNCDVLIRVLEKIVEHCIVFGKGGKDGCLRTRVHQVPEGRIGIVMTIMMWLGDGMI